MATQTVRIEYDVDGLNDLKKATNAVEDLDKATEDLGDQQEQTSKKTKDANKNIGEATKTFGSLGDQLKDTLNRVNVMGKGLGDLTSDLGKSNGALLKNIKSLKSLKIAIASTGVGLLVIALGTLVTFFTKTQRGSDKLNQAFAAVGATVDVLIDRVSRFGEGLFKLFSRDTFQEGLDLLKGSFAGVGEEIVNEANAAFELEKQLQAIEKREVALIVTRERSRAAIKALNKDAEDISKSIEERQKAIQEAVNIENRLQKERVAIQAERVRILREQQSLGENLLEDDRELAEAEAELFRIRQESDEQLTTLGNRNNNLIIQLQKQNTETRELTKAIEDRFSTEKQLAEDKEALDEELAERRIGRVATVSEQEIAINEEAAGIKRDIDLRTEEQKIEATKTGFSAIAGLIAQGLGNSKEAAIFSGLISTSEAAIAAFKAVAGIPVIGPTLAPVAAAAATKFGLQNVNQIRNKDVPKFSLGGRIGGNLHEAGGTTIEAERDEFVMSRKATSKYGFDLMDKINGLEIDPDVLDKNGGSVNVVDTRPIAEAISRQPRNVINVDEKGFTKHMIGEHAKYSEKISRYKCK